VNYSEFLDHKAQLGGDHGFSPVKMPGWLFDFQAALVEWALRKGRAAIFADCGLGKTPMELVWADNVVRKTGGKVLLLSPLAVGHEGLVPIPNRRDSSDDSPIDNAPESRDEREPPHALGPGRRVRADRDGARA